MAARLTMLADLDDQLAKAAAATRRLRLGFDALAILVKDEHADCQLALIAAACPYREVTPEMVQALRDIEAADEAGRADAEGDTLQSACSAQWQARVTAAEAALVELTHIHHTTLAPSKLHDPRNGKSWADCPCRTCQRTAALLPETADDWRRCECRARYGVDADGTRPAIAMCPNAHECAARIATESAPGCSA
jgi:hypothetical protein